MAATDQPPASSCKVQGAAWTPHLIDHYTQLFFVTVQSQHGECKVFATGPITQLVRSTLATGCKDLFNRLFAAGFASAVDPQWFAALIHSVGGALLTVENKIGAQLQQSAAALLSLCKCARAAPFARHGPAPALLLLCPPRCVHLHSAPNQGGARFTAFLTSLGIGQIEG